MHNHCGAICTKAHVKLHTLTLCGACHESIKAVLANGFGVGSSVREKEWTPERFACATDRAQATIQEATPAEGNVMVNVVPTPVVEVTVISPP